MPAVIFKWQIMMAFSWQRKLFVRAAFASKSTYLPFHTKTNFIKSKLKKKSESNNTKQQQKPGAHLRYICFRRHLKKQIWKFALFQHLPPRAALLLSRAEINTICV